MATVGVGQQPLAHLPWPVAHLHAAETQPPPPRLTDPVNDFAKVIDPQSAAELERLIRALQQAAGDVVVVATVPSFQPYADIREYAVKMFENHGEGVGDRGKDNGLLIVVAVDDRQVGIEVGHGLEGFITDGFAGQTIRESIRPEFRSGQYGRGLVAGTTRIVNRIADARGATLQDVPRQGARREAPLQLPCGTIFLVLLLFWLMSRGARRRRRRRYWGGGPWSGWSSGVGPFGGFGGPTGGFGGGFGGFGGSGGFGGFGGGRSGGGGASAGW